ncbi:MAG: hypothetical protein EBZ49_03005 [Proteobacteria bacterium]|nr:hypothetical protein [Pseudomonadota bacterium]
MFARVAKARAVYPTSATPSSSNYTPVQYAKQIGTAHNGVVSNADTPSINRVLEVLPITTTPTNAFNGSQSSVEFVLPPDMGKYYDGVVQFEMNINDASGSVSLTPTFAWLQRLEVYLGGEVIESVEWDELLEQSYFWLTDQERQTIASKVNINPTTGGYASATTNGSSKRFYLPLWANVLQTAQPWVKGFGQQNLRVKLWFQPSIRVDNGTTGVTISTCKLYATEATLSAGEEARLESAHKTGMCYRTIIRNKFIYPASSLSYNTSQQAQMTSLNNPTAGIEVYIKPNTNDNAYVFAKWAADQIQLRDSNNADLTVLQAGDLYVNFQNQWQTPRSPVGCAQPNMYIFSFCQNLTSVVETGERLGAYQLTGNERVVVYPSSTATITTASGQVSPPQGGLTNVQIVAVSFEYAKIEVHNNVGKRSFGL